MHVICNEHVEKKQLDHLRREHEGIKTYNLYLYTYLRYYPS